MNLAEKHRIFLRCSDCANYIKTSVKIDRNKRERNPDNIEELKAFDKKCEVCGNNVTWREDSNNAYYQDWIPFNK